MKRLSTLSTAIALFLSCISFSATAQMNTFWADTLNKTFSEFSLNQKMDGVTASVVFSDGSVWAAAGGKHGSSPLSVDYLYDMGSCTKTMISTIIMLLEEEKALSINDTIYSYIDPLNNVANGITIKQLLNHTSGVFDYTRHPDFVNDVFSDQTKFWHPDTILKRYINAPHFMPGTDFRYSNTGYVILGRIIEVVEKKPLNEVLKQRLFTPLNLENTFLDQYDAYAQVKTGAWLDANTYFDDEFVSLMSTAWAAGGVVTTPQDFATYTHKLYRGDVLSSTSMDKLLESLSQLGFNSEYGLGVIKTRYKGRTYLGHDGVTLQNSEMDYSVSSDFSVIVVCLNNGFGMETYRMKNKLIDLIEYIEEVHDSVSQAVHVDPNVKPATVLKAYPNPSTGSMTLNYLGDKTANPELNIYDLQGRLVFQSSVVNGSVTLSSSDLGNGIFVARLDDQQGGFVTTRIVFQ
ncbi:MAG: serine hydrolase [Bacteroidia bacterium]|nr:serine hydrolase [Bacteroidia bacterium]